MEEERRLCYVGMTRAEKRLHLTWARYRRRFGGGQPEVCLPSRFLNEVPTNLRERLSPYKQTFGEEVDLFSEQHDVRESVKRNLYTGRTYNSVENISQFFAERGMPMPSGFTRRPEPGGAKPASSANKAGAPPALVRSARTVSSAAAPGTRPQTSPAPVTPQSGSQTRPMRGQTGFRAGTVIQHPKYGRGTILRREGEGEDAKLTISFPGHGLKKIVEKYAGFKVEE
jgi:DNA helicase-2/ATP-dependent DNA helicase PcrA